MSPRDEFNALLTRFEEQQEENKVDDAITEDSSSERDNAIKAWNTLQAEHSQLQKDSTEIKKQATDMMLDLQKCKETLKKMEEERAQANNTHANETRSELEKLRTERDEVIREQDECESEIRTLHRKGKQPAVTSKHKCPSPSTNEDISMADNEGDGDLDIPLFITETVQQAMCKAVVRIVRIG
ncbi:hypothetical protein AAF712_015933 [Marasmius tenuissimus]|uniref:Uncharacterized protein n=1 Tax=Marasmius tenuissimus TaxID=585030 RepID=A0ABR2Z850_9AGAR